MCLCDLSVGNNCYGLREGVSRESESRSEVSFVEDDVPKQRQPRVWVTEETDREK